MAKYTDNPSIHIDEFGHPHLNIFLHFFYEKDLPKYIPVPKDPAVADEKSMAEAGFDSEITSAMSPSRITSSEWGYRNALLREIQEENNRKKKNVFSRLFHKIKSKFHRGIPVEEIFSQAKDKLRLPVTKDLEQARKSAEALEKFLASSGQKKQAEKVRQYCDILAGEIILLKNGIDKYLLEEDIIDFMLKSEKGVFIDFLRNFSNILPLDVAKKKIDIDKLLVFDNYCVMYYDPSIDPFRELKDEETRRKTTADPILFGMILGSNKLYYITDWIYKDDDLTMEKVEEVMGRKSRALQNAEIADTTYNLHQYITEMSDQIILSINSKPASSDISTQKSE